MAAKPEISVVVATRNRATRLARLLDSLRRQQLDGTAFEVVVVDDGSTDDTPRVLSHERSRHALDVRVLRHETSRGPAAARNTGWRAARGRVIAFIDDDCVAAPGWLSAGLEAMGREDEHIVQGRTDPDPDEAHRIGPFSRTLRITSLGPNFQTCNIFYPRALLERVSGFAETAFSALSAEDADLAWRCLAEGARPVFAAEAQVFHAIHVLGPVGRLRLAWRWHEIPGLYARHPERRDMLTYGVFWKKSHYILLRAVIGFVLPRRLAPLRYWFFAPLAPSYRQRARNEGGRPWHAPYFVVHDAVEIAAIVRGALRARFFMI